MRRDFEAPGRSPVYAREAAVATSHPLATSAAIEVLQSGGNAVDAAIAAAAVQCVVEPQMTGIGGDLFAIVTEPDGRMAGFNGSGAAPKALTPALLAERGVDAIEATSAHAVTVPGAVRAWETLLKAHGSRNFRQLLKRAIDYADNGFPVAPRVNRDWEAAVPKLRANKAAAASYLVDGEAPEIGSIMKFPRLAETLRAIASDGADGFYTGEVAEDIVATLKELGGVMTLDDLAAAHTTAVAPVLRDYRGHTIAELPPNGQGVIALVMLGLLERFDLGAFSPISAERYHLEMEAARIAYAVRDKFITDPNYMDIGTARLLSEDYIDQLARMIRLDRRLEEVPGNSLAPQTDTIYLSVVDKDGLSVSLIQSVFQSFGSGILAADSGVMLHNRGFSFKAKPGFANTIDGGKRPMHTIIPAFGLKDGHPWLSFGVMGGHYQACGHAHLITNIVDYGMDPQMAIDFPRMFFDMDTHALEAEKLIPASTLDGLKDFGHEVRRTKEAIGGSQAIMIDRAKGLLIAGSDPRKDGHAAGY
ncbi:gamma-glutamyltransferase [Roseibium aestuarii]|uniref:Glutathione hydrolase proenzyme n=1 Tax=Roseibium aestuarii TaxID=2600299 RepID=A0ABW4K3L1_9HYPH|nr:gamma-glutamyltransferase [Roseibium aestuarii]